MQPSPTLGEGSSCQQTHWQPTSPSAKRGINKVTMCKDRDSASAQDFGSGKFPPCSAHRGRQILNSREPGRTFRTNGRQSGAMVALVHPLWPEVG